MYISVFCSRNRRKKTKEHAKLMTYEECLIPSLPRLIAFAHAGVRCHDDTRNAHETASGRSDSRRWPQVGDLRCVPAWTTYKLHISALSTSRSLLLERLVQTLFLSDLRSASASQELGGSITNRALFLPSRAMFMCVSIRTILNEAKICASMRKNDWRPGLIQVSKYIHSTTTARKRRWKVKCIHIQEKHDNPHCIVCIIYSGMTSPRAKTRIVQAMRLPWGAWRWQAILR